MSRAEKKSAWRSESKGKVVLEKFNGFEKGQELCSCDPKLLRAGCVIDLETTGTKPAISKIIEVALRQFQFNRETGEVVTIGEEYSALQDPGEALSDFTIMYTGLSDSILEGQEADWTKVNQMLTEVDLVIAHNARFDRGFLDRQLPVSREKIWGCSHAQVDWLNHGFTKSNLEMLCAYHGFYFEAHRAMGDVDACLRLLSEKSATGPYLFSVLEAARTKRTRVMAFKTIFEKKDLLRERGYAWNPGSDKLEKHWWKNVVRDDLEEELSWLKENTFAKFSKTELRKIGLNQTFTNNS